ncbi:MAG: ATP-binding protein [Thiotrichaceae bacterium]
MAQLFGEYEEETCASQEYLVLGFSPSSIPVKQRWRNNGLSADFLADYLTTFYPIDPNDPDSVYKRTEIKSAVSYIANELLENAMKFHDETSLYPISIQMRLREGMLKFCVTNSVHSHSLRKFKTFIQELVDNDPQELYIRKLEQNALEDTHTGSGLGLLTMMNDYTASVGWKFDIVQVNPEVVTVTTMVRLRVV